LRKLNSVLRTALTANTFEFYEFTLSGFMALEIGKLFFPATEDKRALILSFAMFAASYLTRPVGGVLLGWLGNRCGAGTVLKLSVTLMAIPTMLIAFLPTYQTAGYWATGLLLALKMVQGFAVGGEVPLNVSYVSENTVGKDRGLYFACICTSGFLGMLLASFLVLILQPIISTLSSLFPVAILHTRLNEAWRWPFLLSIPLSLWVLWMRASISDGSAHRPTADRSVRPRPIAPLLQAFVLMAFLEVNLYTVFVWLPNYLNLYLGVALSEARELNVITIIVLSIAIVCAGYLSRWIDGFKLAFFSVCAMLLSTYPLFVLLQKGDFVSLLCVHLAFAFVASGQLATVYLVLADLFKDNWKSLGVGIGFSAPTAVFGGTAPLMCSYLLKYTEVLTVPALYIIAMGLLAAPVAYRLAFPRQERRTNASMAV
jgi:MHS family proline/betaine transporter-like MFS transporter